MCFALLILLIVPLIIDSSSAQDNDLLPDFNIVLDNLLTKKPEQPLTPTPNVYMTVATKFQFPILDENFSIPIKQSEQCTERELDLRIQCFRNVPQKDNYVLVNESLIIPCLVNNQHGKVQWRAKNLVLGYDRSVPGMPRLQIVGDVTKGEHNLHLYRVQLSDSGEYECQVQPVEIHPLLRRRTTLYVTNLPSPPVITYKHQMPDNNEIIINAMQDSENLLVLTCATHGGVPQPSFQWTWNTRFLENSLTSDIKIQYPNPGLSILNIPVSFFKSGHTIGCGVKNKATELADSGNSKTIHSFESKIKVILYTPPGNPQIEYAPKSQIIEAFEGRTLELVCSLKPIGKPNAILKFRLESPTDSIFLNHQTTILDKQDGRILTRLLIQNVTREYHFCNLSCISQHPLTIKETVPLTVLVKHIPKWVSIRHVESLASQDLFENYVNIENSLDSSIEGVEEEDVHLICVSGSYYGTIKMSWQLEAAEQLDESRFMLQTLSALVKKEFRWPRNSTTQTAITQILKLKRSYNSGVIVCQVITEDGHMVSSRTKFNVYYLPKLSVISGYVSQFPLHEGDMIQLTCCAYGGNPIPRLRWLQNKKILVEKSPNISTSSEQTLVFIGRMFRMDNGQQLYCEGGSDKIPLKTVRSNQIVVNVVFPPSQLKLVCENCVSQRMFTNVTTHFLCETSSSNPGSFIVWKILNCRDNRNHSAPQCPLSVIEGSMATNVPGSNNGWRSQSRVNIRLSHKHNGMILECESTLSHKMFPDRYKSLSKQIVLHVLHPPVLLNFKSNSRVTVDEGSNITIPILFSANPAATNYLWYLNKMIISTENALNIVNVNSSQGGIYVFQVFNLLGSASTSINIDIEYSPRILSSWTTSLADHSSIFCSATSNPMFRDKTLFWSKLIPRDQLTNPTETYHQTSVLSINATCLHSRPCPYGICTPIPASSTQKYSTSCRQNISNHTTEIELIIKSHKETDFGWFMCTFDNRKGPQVSRMVHLKIPIKPKHINVMQYSKFGGQFQQVSSLYCCFLSHIKPDIIWLAPPFNKSKPSNSISEVAIGTFCGQLDVYISDTNQYGSYVCEAINEIGNSKEATVLLQTTFRPESPSLIHVHLLNNSTALISWTQMAHGGGTQIFQLRWKRKLESSPYQYKTITGNPSLERLSVKLSDLQSGIYVFEIGTSSTLYSTIQYCCRTEFTMSKGKSSSTKHSNINTIQVAANNPTNLSDIYRNNAILVTFMSTIVAILSIIVLVFIFIYIVKYRRKMSQNNSHSQKSPYKQDNSLYLRSQKITKLNEIPTTNEDFSQDFQIEIKSNDEESPLSEEEKIKFLTSLAAPDQCKYFPLQPSSTFYQMDPISNIYSANNDIKTITMSKSSLQPNPLFYQGIYGKFIVQNYQPCDCQLSLPNEGLVIVSKQ